MENPREETVPLGSYKLTEPYFLPPMPEKIGAYKIERFLKKGGMSLLYLAKHPKTSEMAVIKVILPKFLKSPEVMSHLIREAKILGSSAHPNIVKLHEIGEWENGLFIAMEYIEGVSLRQFIKDHSLNHRRVLEILLEIAYGLAHLHEKGILHLDLKPENVLLTESGKIKLIDFGISEFIEKGRDAEKMWMGTPDYMSPEQRNAPSQVSMPSDIYSLGIIAYELYVGKLSHGTFHLDLLPKKLRKIIAGALEVDPKKRTQKVIGFIADLLEFMKSLDKETHEEAEAEMLDLIQTIDKVLIPAPPNWPELEIGLAVRVGTTLNSLYVDFFQLSDNRFAIVFAEPVTLVGGDSIGPTAMLRGMVRLLFEEPMFHPAKTLSRLNDSLYRDPMGHKFGLSLLLLEPEKNHLSFFSCGEGTLAHYPEKHLEPDLFTPQGPLLGATPNPLFNEMEENWGLESILLLSPLALKPSLSTEDLVLSAKPLSELAINQCVKNKTTPNTTALVVIHRI
jgi:hypothetical protein